MSAAEAIERVLPYDGPHSVDTVTDAAYGISRLVRYLNNATQGAGPGHVGSGQVTLAMAPTVDSVVGSVKSAASLLDQLLRQLCEALERLADDETLYDDRRWEHPEASPSGTVYGAIGALEDAMTRARGLAIALADVHSHTSHLGHDVPRGGER